MKNILKSVKKTIYFPYQVILNTDEKLGTWINKKLTYQPRKEILNLELALKNKENNGAQDSIFN